jgi:hypothetical protein
MSSCSCTYSRVPTESRISTCAGKIDILGHRKRVQPVTKLLVAAVFSRSLRFMPLRVPTRTGLSRVSRRSRWELSSYTRWSEDCRSLFDVRRHTEVAFRSLKYCQLSLRVEDTRYRSTFLESSVSEPVPCRQYIAFEHRGIIRSQQPTGHVHVHRAEHEKEEVTEQPNRVASLTSSREKGSRATESYVDR